LPDGVEFQGGLSSRLTKKAERETAAFVTEEFSARDWQERRAAPEPSQKQKNRAVGWLAASDGPAVRGFQTWV